MSKLSNFGAKMGAVAIAMGLAAGGALAAMNAATINVTLPDAVSVGNTTIPSGEYRISEIELGTVESMFVFRDNNGATAAVVTADRTADPADVTTSGASKKTELLLAPSEDGALHLRQMFIEGDSVGFNFMK